MKFDYVTDATELLANPELVNDLFVPIEIFALKVIQQLAALADHSERPRREWTSFLCVLK
jgi:hypothetical protein